MFSKIKQLLHEDGLLIIDLIPLDTKTINASSPDKHHRVIETPFGKDYGYFPSDEDLVNYAKT